MMLVADYMPPPWWFLPALFWPLWLPLVVVAIVGGLIDLGRWLERRSRK